MIRMISKAWAIPALGMALLVGAQLTMAEEQKKPVLIGGDGAASMQNDGVCVLVDAKGLIADCEVMSESDCKATAAKHASSYRFYKNQNCYPFTKGTAIADVEATLKKN